MRLDIEKALADIALELADHDPTRISRCLTRVHEEHAERAAVREYLGGMTRLGAEVAAVDDTRSAMGLDSR